MPTLGFNYRADDLFCEDVSLAAIAEQAGTPSYVYSGSAIVSNYRAYDQSLQDIPHEVHYAVKANSSLACCRFWPLKARVRHRLGRRAFTASSRRAEIRPRWFSPELARLARRSTMRLESGVGYFNCESEPELALLAEIAKQRGVRPAVALRVKSRY